MEWFETFRGNLIQQMAELLDIPVEGFSTQEIWLVLQERYPEAVRVTSEQWLKADLLEEHLFTIEQERALSMRRTDLGVVRRQEPASVSF